MPIYRLDADDLTPVEAPADMVELDPAQDVHGTLATLIGARAIALRLPKLRDGRAFSQARVLREAGYRGDICLRGALYADQMLHAAGCGATLIELPVEALAAARRNLARLSALRGRAGARHIVSQVQSA